MWRSTPSPRQSLSSRNNTKQPSTNSYSSLSEFEKVPSTSSFEEQPSPGALDPEHPHAHTVRIAPSITYEGHKEVLVGGAPPGGPGERSCDDAAIEADFAYRYNYELRRAVKMHPVYRFPVIASDSRFDFHSHRGSFSSANKDMKQTIAYLNSVSPFNQQANAEKKREETQQRQDS